MNLEYRVASDIHRDFIFNECMTLVRKYEDLKIFDINEIIKFERSKVDNEIEKYTAVYDDGTFIGCFKLTKDNEVYELDDLYIVEEHRNKGYGTEILKECIRNTPITLWVFTANKVAYDLYVRMGFKVIQDLKTRVQMKKES